MKYRDFVASSDIPIALAGRALASHYRPEPGGSPFLYPFPFVNQFTTEPGIKKNGCICNRLFGLRRGRDSNPRSLSAQQFSRLP